MSASPIDPDDLEEWIEAIVEEKTKFLRTYDAVVENNVDSLLEGKVQLSVHSLGWVDANQWIWAEPEFPVRGSWMMPDKGDEVKLYFEEGDETVPVYRGYSYFEKDSPETLFTKGVLLKTPLSEIEVSFDDLLKQFLISVGGSAEIKMDGVLQTLALTLGMVTKIEMDDLGKTITLTLGTTKIILDSTGQKIDIELNPTTAISLSATGIQFKTGDSTGWHPNILSNCLFTGAPHGGLVGGILKLKGG